ncbi:MAG: inorganic diphosphatase [Nitrososphaerota archaeon]|nr:inorganic diphosphatase [Candidatus Bathyarchaeota archaeon]MCX8162277.1 inorganic diphosphatase [Candidatus Bathyarchaeota archaeon]MDW8061393.1 inorganic diphosphatase [Nitrososphaerota archaeon]
MWVSKLKPGPEGKLPKEVYILIEVPKGSKNKYEIDKETGLLVLDRVLFTSMAYPCDYGFIPGTLCEDGDPLDCLLITSQPLNPGILVKARPVALMLMRDEKGKDEKLIAVPTEDIDPRLSNIRSLRDIPEAVLREIEHFFEHYKELEPGKWVKVEGWLDADKAEEIIEKAVETYRRNIGGKL